MTYHRFAVETEASETGCEPRHEWFGDALQWAQNAARITSTMVCTAILIGIRHDGSEDVLEGWFEGKRTHTATGWEPAA